VQYLPELKTQCQYHREYLQISEKHPPECEKCMEQKNPADDLVGIDLPLFIADIQNAGTQHSDVRLTFNLTITKSKV
jgi:hypothetical protein